MRLKAGESPKGTNWNLEVGDEATALTWSIKKPTEGAGFLPRPSVGDELPTSGFVLLRSGLEDYASTLIRARRIARAVVLSLQHHAFDGVGLSRAGFHEGTGEQTRGRRERELQGVRAVVYELAA